MSRLFNGVKLSVLEKNDYKCKDCGNTIDMHNSCLHHTKGGLVVICCSCSEKRGFTK